VCVWEGRMRETQRETGREIDRERERENNSMPE